ncbi:hypothetical protein GCM10010510_63800 [Streptomyces anandii JCM 4720]|nr:hypothetical protein GCM10010510_63800 [Streptomyces anandii JCM 4720]
MTRAGQTHPAARHVQRKGAARARSAGPACRSADSSPGPFHERTITAPSVLRAELEAVIEQGYGMSGPVYRLGPDRLPGLAKRSVAAGAELSHRIGYGFRPGPADGSRRGTTLRLTPAV